MFFEARPIIVSGGTTHHDGEWIPVGGVSFTLFRWPQVTLGYLAWPWKSYGSLDLTTVWMW